MPRLPAEPFTINWREPEVPSYFMLYIKRGSVLVPARIWMADHEPGEPNNKRDRWPREHIAGEIAGKWVDPLDIWERFLLGETRPNHWKCARPLVPKDGLTVSQEYEYQLALLRHAREREPANPLARPWKEVDLRTLPLPF
jgi:hypothetical protein